MRRRKKKQYNPEDKLFTNSVSIPEEVPVKLFDLNFEENKINFNNQNNNHNNIIFFILFNNDLNLTEKVITKLKFNNNHHFIINVCPDIKNDIKEKLLNLFKNDINVTILYCGYINYPTSTELKIIFSVKKYLSNIENWDLLVCLANNDYPLFKGEYINKNIGKKSWFDKNIGKKYSKNELLEYKDLARRFLKGLEPTETRKKYFPRKLWLYDLLPDIKISWGMPLSSGGIFSKDTVDFLVNNNKCKLIYNFCLFMSCAAVEHYWHTCYQLPYFKDKLKDKKSCHMEWNRGRPGKIPGTSNTFLTLNEWDIIEKEFNKETLFIRKFDSKKEIDVLNKIDELKPINN